MLLGLISDTHDYFDPRLPEVFAGVDRILHAGDICSHRVLSQLEAIAPVTAVLGNNDFGMDLPDTELVEVSSFRILARHIVRPDALTPLVRERIEVERPDMVLFGHSHQRCDEVRDGRRFVNPGYAGKPRFNLRRSVALVGLGSGSPKLRFIDL
jgi:putative phosphoesterase